MFVARILYPVKTLGPGNRIGIWFAGCQHGCPGCSNPELWTQRPDQHMTVSALSQLVHRMAQVYPVDGISLTGGDPLEQEEIIQLLEQINDITRDVLIYTGYKLEELTEEQRRQIAAHAAVLIDGEYQAALNTGTPLIGSQNQRIHYFRPEVIPLYKEYLRSGACTAQNFTLRGNSVVSVGIHLPSYPTDLARLTSMKGLIAHDDD